MRSVLRNHRAKERIKLRDCRPEGQRCAPLAEVLSEQTQAG
jgi:hypothetical protein